MQHIHYYLGFNLTPGIGPMRLNRLIDYFGSIDEAWKASASDLRSSGLDRKSCEALLATRTQIDLEAEVERATQLGVDLICIEDTQYPPLLRQIAQPPPLLYVRGNFDVLDEGALAVVGTRSPTSYGKEATRRVVYDLATVGMTIVSGLALGIDSIAHKVALEAKGRTLAVLGSGVDVPYPERNTRLAQEIIENGALISEYPLGTKPVPANFPPRNRLISGLSLGTLVVEAGVRSGALITVTFALEQGRDVFAIPGSIFSRTSSGPHRLLRDGAGLVTSAQDVLEAVNWSTVTLQHEAKKSLPEDPTEVLLLELIEYEPRHIDELSRVSNLSVATISATLAMLELKGLIRQAGAMHYMLVREDRAAYNIDGVRL
ncbi:MAG: putative Rossmann fold nucleotide-binding protein DprA/Smf involved in DNA uptake [Chloroflexi bacterium AL-W]|nr:putative Rossmann fold nucleotide-binding protein DprA/Smf involved in DNA uptake [Chloroflexi bacterium AL-N1]NOK66170.1 putative Rossmann fold nucleotide-binding protein DprA/Smf involved in DNA uptake [Chloroflexi bacterium AL-N10]NOK73051.1 putative Rossmann fold nucleotide-binding protein DprA/Smf involved in DNA uptake [Chloroflexi bacterium AL-N5]NOK79948.1 putative Rossmann fold nucleotide-binding protein DprA/Smf involved in DNA uptake [Chloroflexi bacterium AL-W]NOK88196.1 putative